MSPVRVIVVDDDAGPREALAALVDATPSLELAGVADGVAGGLELARAEQPDVALVDVRMPDGGGPRLASELRDNSPEIRVVALSAYDDRATVVEMLQAGAVSYLVKGTSNKRIVETLERSAAGSSRLATEVTGEVIGELRHQLELRGEETEASMRMAARVRGVLERSALHVVFQPVVDLATREIVGYEALSRFRGEPDRGTEVWFKEADAVGLGAQLELAAVRAAVAQLGNLPASARLMVNVSPASAVLPELREILSGPIAERVTLEITEYAPVEDYEAFKAGIAKLRRAGVRLAIDDAGAGFASLRHILQLEPDVIKLDLSLTRGIDADRLRHALAVALTAFAAEIGVDIIAEGIETQAELDTLGRLGVSQGQGYLLGRPAPLDPPPPS